MPNSPCSFGNHKKQLTNKPPPLPLSTPQTHTHTHTHTRVRTYMQYMRMCTCTCTHTHTHTIKKIHIYTLNSSKSQKQRGEKRQEKKKTRRRTDKHKTPVLWECSETPSFTTVLKRDRKLSALWWWFIYMLLWKHFLFCQRSPISLQKASKEDDCVIYIYVSPAQNYKVLLLFFVGSGVGWIDADFNKRTIYGEFTYK